MSESVLENLRDRYYNCDLSQVSYKTVDKNIALDRIKQACNNHNSDLLYVSRKLYDSFLGDEIYYFIYHSKDVNDYFNLKNSCNNFTFTVTENLDTLSPDKIPQFPGYKSLLQDKEHQVMYIGKSIFDFINLIKNNSIATLDITFSEPIFENKNIFEDISFRDLSISNISPNIKTKIYNRIHHQTRRLTTIKNFLKEKSLYKIREYHGLSKDIYDILNFIFIYYNFDNATYDIKENFNNIKDKKPFDIILNDDVKKVISDFINFMNDDFRDVKSFDYNSILNVIDIFYKHFINHYKEYYNNSLKKTNKKSYDNLDKFYINLCRKYMNKYFNNEIS